MQLAIILMPDENRDVLQTLLLFLNEVASHSYVNQMCEKNLATCFVPAFFHLCGGGGSKTDRNQQSSAPKKLKRSVSQQCQKELEDTIVRFFYLSFSYPSTNAQLALPSFCFFLIKDLHVRLK